MPKEALDLFLTETKNWYEEQRNDRGHVNTNVMNAGLIVAEMVKDGVPVLEDRLLSDGGSQVRGLSGAAIARILARNGESRTFTAEGGRTSRGTVVLAQAFSARLSQVAMIQGPVDIPLLDQISQALEGFFTSRVQSDYFDRQRLKVELAPSLPVSLLVDRILQAVANRADRPAGIVMQHLVGAKLQLRFPDEAIGRDKATTADQQLSRSGDFEVGTTAFHVTVSPSEKLIVRCRQNRADGIRPVILVPENKVAAARQLAEIGGIADLIAVQSVESFVGTNIEEMASYADDEIRSGLASLIGVYNERILDIEADKSLCIETPSWMRRI